MDYLSGFQVHRLSFLDLNFHFGSVRYLCTLVCFLSAR